MPTQGLQEGFHALTKPLHLQASAFLLPPFPLSLFLLKLLRLHFNSSFD
jgi:hypothetical protein